MKILVTDFDHVVHEVTAEADWPIMEAIRSAGLPIKAECGGCCLCATCHVYVDDAWVGKIQAMDDEEEMMLGEAPEVRPSSRLSCQMRMAPELDGLVLSLAPTY